MIDISSRMVDAWRKAGSAAFSDVGYGGVSLAANEKKLRKDSTLLDDSDEDSTANASARYYINKN
jgi:hypothetical protein